MELTTLEQIEELKYKLRKSIIEQNQHEKDIIIVQLKEICPHIRLDNLWKESRVLYFKELRCNENCEDCIHS